MVVVESAVRDLPVDPVDLSLLKGELRAETPHHLHKLGYTGVHSR